jgi:hypothetical protein
LVKNSATSSLSKCGIFTTTLESDDIILMEKVINLRSFAEVIDDFLGANIRK